MSGSQRHYYHSASPAFHFGRADDRFLGVVSAFNDHVWTQELHQIERRVFRKNYHQIDTFERGENVSTLGIAADGSIRSLQSSHGLVAIDPNNQCVRGLSRGSQHIDVTGMKQVEDSVGEGDLTFPCRPPPLRLDPRGNFAGRIAWFQSLLATVGLK